MNALKIAAVGAEIAILGATTSVAWGLVGGSRNLPVVAPVLVAVMALETLRLPIVLRLPKLSLFAAGAALALALALSALTGETMALGVETLFNERAIAVTAAETRLSQAETSFDAVKADARRRGEIIDRLGAEVAAAAKHSEEIGREAVALQNNPAVSAYRSRKGWTAPGGPAANAAASANAKAQAEHARRLAAAEADLAAARAALTAAKPIDLKAKEADLVAAKHAVVREREASPMHRLAASIFRVEVGDMPASDYEAVRRVSILSIAALVSVGTLGAGLISSLPDRGAKRPSKLARALRKLAARWRRRLVIRRDVPGPIEYRDRVRVVHVPVDRITGLVVDPDAKAP
jgi:hypothetical protein